MPHRPGVYLMRDAGKTILYVGKANDLHNRVRSYFVALPQLPEKTARLVSQIADIDFFIATSEEEALILENNLIKQYHPRFNVRLKDDKTFPYLKIDIAEDWPTISITRRMEPDGGRYFGPFASSRSVKQTLRIIQRIFPVRICTRAIKGRPRPPCLEYHLGRCLGPCTGTVSRQEYARAIKEVILFLEGKQDRVIKEFKAQMDEAAAAMDYEKAARLRDRTPAIHDGIEGEKVAAVIRGEEGVIAFVQQGDQAYVQVLFIRRSKLTGREGFLLQGTRQEEPPEIMTSFVKQYYASSPQIPPLLLLQHPVEDKLVIREWLKGKRRGKVEIQVPRRGNKKQLIDIAAENARFGVPEVNVGLIPGWGGTQRLPRKIPWCRAAELLLTGRPIDAQEAYRIGLVNKVVPLKDLMATAKEWADMLCQPAPLAVRAAKEAMLRGSSSSLEEGLRIEEALFASVVGTADLTEGLKAFSEKRKPKFTGEFPKYE